MAEFALGLTKTAVEGTLSSVRLAIEEEAKLEVRVQKDLVFIRGEFQMMQSFLSVANSERAKNEVVRTWVRQIRDLAIDVEDCVDFVVHLDRRSSWAWLWRLVPSFCGAPPQPLDVAVAQIQLLKARVEDVSHRNTRYNLIGGSNSPPAAAAVSPAEQPARATSSFRVLNKIWEATGRKRGDMGDLRKLITSEGNDLQVISLWGSTGGGAVDLAMTNIIRNAYNHPEVSQEFRIRAWVKLERPFDPDEFLKSLLTQFYPMEPSVARAHHARLFQQVNRHRCLVILQDVSTQVEWDAIRIYLPDTNTGSRIVVSTKQLGIALSCTGDPYQVSELTRFSGDQSICAFFKKGSGHRRGDMGEFKWQIRRRGVISVWGLEDFVSTDIFRMYEDKAMSNELEGGLGFKRQSWVDVTGPFNRILFARSLVASSYPQDETDIHDEAYSMQWEEVFARCRRLLSEDGCIIVINGLPSTDYWDSIKTTFFLSGPIKCCVLVTTEEKSVATYCADHEYRTFNIDDSVLHPLVTASGRRRSGMREFKCQIRRRGVVSVWGLVDFESTGIRSLYGGRSMSNELELLGFKRRSWIDVPGPFNRILFARSLIARSDPQDGTDEHSAVYSMPWEEVFARCRRFLNKDDCIIVINGLQSTDYWDSIKTTFLSGPTKCCVLVTTGEKSVATHCAYHENLAFNIDDLVLLPEENPDDLVPGHNNVTDQAAAAVLPPLITGSGRRHSDMDEFKCQIRRRGVVSVWGLEYFESTSIHRLYNDKSMSNELDGGLGFRRRSWIDVPGPFSGILFARSLVASSYPQDETDDHDAAYSMQWEEGLSRCHKFLSEDDCIIVINGLQSTDYWNSIKTTFLSVPTKCCIIVTTKEKSVATHCADHECRVFNIDDLVLREEKPDGLVPRQNNVKDQTAALVLRPLITASGHRSGIAELIWQLRCCGVISVWGVRNENSGTGNGRSNLIDEVYKGTKDKLKEFDGVKFDWHSWVVVPEPFGLTVFSRLLCENLESDTRTIKEKVACELDKMGIDELIGKCRDLLSKDDGFVVISGLRRTKDWDLIKSIFGTELTTKTCVVVITAEASVARHCVKHAYLALNIKDLESDVNLGRLFQKGWQRKEETSQWERLLVCNRSEEALECDKELFGRKNETFKLDNCLKYPGVICVWGIASVGKSDLVRSSYYNRMAKVREKNPMYRDDEELSQLDFVNYSWVDVSHPFNLLEFSQCLLLDFHSDDIGAKEAAAIAIMEGQDPIQGCCKFLCQDKDKCLVVIDGLRSTEDWDLIKDAFLAKPITGCIVVITNEASVATHCVDHENQVINVKCLEDDAALRLFNKLAWNDKVEELPRNIKKLSRNTVDRCGGLPKVVAAVGQYPNIQSRYILESISGDFMSMLEKDPGFHGLRGLFSWMRSYFDACSDSLKPCIFYLSVFPVYQKIRRRRLLRRWIAEGYSRDTSAGSTAEEMGEMFFSDLVSLSIIQQPAASSNVHCQVNAFFHEYIISRQMEDNLVFALEGHCSLNSRRAGQHLTVRSNWDNDAIVFKSIDFSRLRSFTVFGKWMPFFISADVNMELLRVLDLEDTEGVTYGDVEQIGKRLPHLKFLSLRRCEMISRLPDSLGCLKQLQTLDVRHTKIVKLPRAISKLRKLQYIHAGQDVDGGTSTRNLPSPAAPTPPLDDSNATTAGRLSAAAPPPTPALDVGDNTSTRNIPIAVPTPQDDDDATATSSLPAPQQANSGDGTVGGSPQPAGANSVCSSWCSLAKKLMRTRGRLGVNGGVEVPEGIGNLTALHTLGVVNVNGACGEAILWELEDLTQLRKLKVSGINRKNWHKFCSAISRHGHLEYLSVRVDDDEEGTSGSGCFDVISQMPPKTLKCLKLYGCLHKLPAWIDKLDNLKRLDLEMSIATQEDMHALAELTRRDILHCLCLKPLSTIQELHVGMSDDYRPIPINFCLKTLQIDCSSSTLNVTFGFWITSYVELLVVHCSSNSPPSLWFSGLENLLSLKEVRLTGSYGEALNLHLKQECSQHKNEPAFKPFNSTGQPQTTVST